MTAKITRSPVMTPKEQSRKTKISKISSDTISDPTNTGTINSTDLKQSSETYRKTIDSNKNERSYGFHRDRDTASSENTARPRTIEVRVSTENVKKNYKTFLDQQPK